MHKIVIVLLIVTTMLNALSFGSDELEHSGKKLKFESTAQRLSELTTLIPVLVGIIPGRFGQPYRGILAGAGIIFGPSTGHFYAHEWKRGLTGAGLRAGIGALGFGLVLSQAGGRDLWEINYPVIIITTLAAGGAILGSAIYDIATAPSSVRKYNAGIEKRGSLQFQPLIDVGKKQIGLSVVYRF